MPQNLIYVDKLRKEFLERITKPQEVDQLVKDISDNERNAGEYQGRVVLEMIQNMDDQGKGKQITGLIKIEGSNLIVCNEGVPFSEDGIKSVHMSGLSSKEAGENIGNKGLGFRSLLNFSDKIQIFSGDFAVEFSEKTAQEEFEKVKNDPQVIKSINYRTKRHKETYIPMLLTPKNIDYAPERKSNGKYNIDGHEYDTYIKIHLKDDNSIAEIKKQIDNFKARDSISLLFMRSLKTMTFKYDDIVDDCYATPIKTKETLDNPNITKWDIITPDKNGNEVHKHYYLHKQGEIAICFPEIIDIKDKYKLFTFFPMNAQPCDFPVVLHAENFLLVGNRDALEKSPDNKPILKSLLVLLLETANYFAKPEYGTMAMDMLYHNSLSNDSVFYEFKDWFYEKLANCQIIPTLQSEYKSLNDQLRLCPKEFDDCHDVFERIDKTVAEDIKQRLPDELQNRILDFSPAELYDEINKISNLLNSNTRALLFYDWKNFYGVNNLMPKILKNTNGEYFTYNSETHDKIYLTATDMDIIDIPEWATHSVVDIQDKDALCDNINKLGYYNPQDPKTRKIREKYSNDFSSDDISDLLTSISTKIGQDYDNSLDFAVFILKNIKNSARWNEKHTYFKFPTKNGTVLEANKLYFGESYGNLNSQLCELFDLTEFIPFEELQSRVGFNITPQQAVELFGKYYGVNEQPVLLNNTILSDINQNLRQKLCIELDARYTMDIKSISMPHINNLEHALKAVQNTNDTLCILDWLNNMHKAHIMNNYPQTITYIPNGKRSEYTEYKDGNYDRFLLYNTDWLFIGDKKYAPRELLLKSGNDNIKSVPRDWLEKYKDLFVKIGVKTDVWETDDDVFYGIMLDLPSFDTDGTISKQIYNGLTGHYDNYNKSNCKQKQDFLNTGSLFAKNSPVSKGKFVSVKNVKFASAKPINLNKEWLIDKNVRTGNADEFKNIFGIETFEETINVTKTVTHDAQYKFDELWQEFKPFAEIYATKSTEQLQSNLHKVQINVVSYIEGNNVPLVNLDDYALVQNKQSTQWYIYLSENKTIDLSELSRAIGTILSVVANSQKEELKKDIQLLFGASDESARLKVLEEDFGYDVSNYLDHQSIKESFVDALKKALNTSDQSNNPNVDSIDFKNINSNQTIKQIIDVLHACGLHFKDLKANGFEHDIDFNKYHNNKVKELLGCTKSAFERQLYSELLQKSSTEQLQFFTLVENRADVDVFEDDIDCDYNKYCPSVQSSNININAIFHKNLAQFKSENQNYSDEDLESLNNTEKAMVLFEQYDNLKQSLNVKIEKDEENKEQTEKHKESAEYTIIWDDSNVKSSQKTEHRTTGSTKSHSYISGRNLAKARAINGDTAEEAVYTKLENDPEISEVQWVSCAGYRLGKGKENDDSKGYDMTFVRDNKQYFVEVKSVSTNGKTYEFFVSDNEYNVAKEKMENDSYIFALVLPDNKIQFINTKDKIQEILSSATAESLKCNVTI